MKGDPFWPRFGGNVFFQGWGKWKNLITKNHEHKAGRVTHRRSGREIDIIFCFVIMCRK